MRTLGSGPRLLDLVVGWLACTLVSSVMSVRAAYHADNELLKYRFYGKFSCFPES